VSEGTYSVVYLIAGDFKDDFSGPQGMGEASSSATYTAGFCTMLTWGGIPPSIPFIRPGACGMPSGLRLCS
jgi:hypothetical protein